MHQYSTLTIIIKTLAHEFTIINTPSKVSVDLKLISRQFIIWRVSYCQNKHFIVQSDYTHSTAVHSLWGADTVITTTCVYKPYIVTIAITNSLQTL